MRRREASAQLIMNPKPAPVPPTRVTTRLLTIEACVVAAMAWESRRAQTPPTRPVQKITFINLPKQPRLRLR